MDVNVVIDNLLDQIAVLSREVAVLKLQLFMTSRPEEPVKETDGDDEV